MKNKVLKEITDFCSTCSSHECCPEEDCILFRIEQIIGGKMEKRKIKIEVEETLTKVVEVEADSIEEAYDIVYNQYSEEEIVLGSEDWYDTKYYALDEDNNRICEF